MLAFGDAWAATSYISWSLTFIQTSAFQVGQTCFPRLQYNTWAEMWQVFFWLRGFDEAILSQNPKTPKKHYYTTHKQNSRFKLKGVNKMASLSCKIGGNGFLHNDNIVASALRMHESHSCSEIFEIRSGIFYFLSLKKKDCCCKESKAKYLIYHSHPGATICWHNSAVHFRCIILIMLQNMK